MEDQEAVKKVCAGYPLDFLKAEVRHLQERGEEKFPLWQGVDYDAEKNSEGAWMRVADTSGAKERMSPFRVSCKGADRMRSTISFVRVTRQVSQCRISAKRESVGHRSL